MDSLELRTYYVLVCIGLIVAGVLLLVIAAWFRHNLALEGRKASKLEILRDDALRALGGTALGGVAIILLVHMPLEKRFLREISKNVQHSSLVEHLGVALAHQVEEYVIGPQFVYHDYSADHLISNDTLSIRGDDPCIIIHSEEHWIIENTSLEKVVYPIQSFYSEINSSCDYVEDTLIVLTSEAGDDTLVYLDRRSIREMAVRMDDYSVLDTSILLNGAQRVSMAVYSLHKESLRGGRISVAFRFPTENVDVTVAASSECNLVLDGRFSHPSRGDPEICRKDTKGSNPYDISIAGGVLPYQSIQVHWTKNGKTIKNN